MKKRIIKTINLILIILMCNIIFLNINNSFAEDKKLSAEEIAERFYEISEKGQANFTQDDIDFIRKNATSYNSNSETYFMIPGKQMEFSDKELKAIEQKIIQKKSSVAAQNTKTTVGDNSGNNTGINSVNSEISFSEIINALKNPAKTVFSIAICVVFIVGLIIGVKYMISGSNEKANMKEKFIWYIVSVALILSCIGIVEIAIKIANDNLNVVIK